MMIVWTIFRQCFSTLFELGVKHSDVKFREQCFVFLRRSVVNGELSKPEAAQVTILSITILF